MKKILTLCVLGLILSACGTMKEASVGAAVWSCTGKDIAQSNYDGGEYAYIQLVGQTVGGTYPVTKADKVAKGVTKNKTPFECRSNR